MPNSATIPLRLVPDGEPMVESIEAFTMRLTADTRSKHTISAYRRDLQLLSSELEILQQGVSVSEITPSLLDEALSSPAILHTEEGSPRSPASLHRIKAVVWSFFAWAEETGLVSQNPARGVKLRRLPRTPPNFLTDAEKRRLLREIRSRSCPLAKRDRVIVEVFLGTGIRLQELVTLDVDDVDLPAKHLRIVAKGNVPQVKFLKTDLRALLRSYLRDRRRDGTAECDALFLSSRGTRLSPRQVARRLVLWLDRAGIDKRLGPHSLRHSFATALYSKTGDIYLVQRALGHRDPSTTQIYTHLVDGALEEALERL